MDKSTMDRRVLLIAYQFPPVGGAGVQRVTKFVKYLPHWGWSSSVLTVSNPSVPVFDESLNEDIPEGTIVRRARTWEPSYALKASVSGGAQSKLHRQGKLKPILKQAIRRISTFLLQPDPNILWMPNALKAGNRLLRQTPHDAILASGPPFSSFLVAAKLSRRFQLPLILDYRDEWDLSSAYWENKRLDPLSQWIQSRMQCSVVKSAKALVASTQLSARTLEEIAPRNGRALKVTWIYNGFDPDDFSSTFSVSQSNHRRFKLVYVGTLWNLTSVDPFVTAVEDLAHRHPDLAGLLEIHFVGRRTAAQDAVLCRLNGLPVQVMKHNYMNHKEAIHLLLSADALLLLLSDLPGLERVVPAKIFEYMAAGRPILSLAPRGETWDLLREYPDGHSFHPRDTKGISAFLEQNVRFPSHQNGSLLAPWDPTKFSRKNQAKQLADLLNSLV